jgi:hypothetical protein
MRRRISVAVAGVAMTLRTIFQLDLLARFPLSVGAKVSTLRTRRLEFRSDDGE